MTNRLLSTSTQLMSDFDDLTKTEACQLGPLTNSAHSNSAQFRSQLGPYAILTFGQLVFLLVFLIFETDCISKTIFLQVQELASEYFQTLGRIFCWSNGHQASFTCLLPFKRPLLLVLFRQRFYSFICRRSERSLILY